MPTMTTTSMTARFAYERDAETGYRWAKRELRPTKVASSLFRYYDEPYHYVSVVAETDDPKWYARIGRLFRRAQGEIIAIADETHEGLVARHRMTTI